MKHRRTRSPARRALRAGSVALAVGAAATAVTAVTMGIVALPAQGQPWPAEPAEPAVSRIGPLPAGASVSRTGIPAGQALEQVKQRQRHKAAKAAREARQRRAAASRSASRTVTYSGDPRAIARSMMSARYGWGAGEFSCLSSLWDHESGWQVHATNPSSGAYGIPQALPASKMSTYGSDWQNNPATQIAWGLNYIRQSYGTPCGAWSTFQSRGWY
jgi:hypothetical protein